MQTDLERFSPFLKAVGTGPKGNRDLTREETTLASELILDQKLPPEVVGAFLIAWRLKGETVDEMMGALDALKKESLSLPTLNNSIEIAMPLEGKKKNIPLLILTASYLPDEHFVITSSQGAKQKTAVSMLDLLDVLPKNITLMQRDHYLPKLEKLQKLREHLKLRTVFNTLEKLHHPLQSDYAVIGAHHGPYFKKYAAIFSGQYRRMMVVQGDEGCGEIIKKSKVHLIEAGQLIEEFVIDPKEFGVNFTKSDKALSLDEMKEMIKHPSDDIVKLAKINAALYLYTLGKSSSLQVALKKYEL